MEATWMSIDRWMDKIGYTHTRAFLMRKIRKKLEEFNIWHFQKSAEVVCGKLRTLILCAFLLLWFLKNFLFLEIISSIQKLQKYYKYFFFPEHLRVKLLLWCKITLRYFLVYFLKQYIILHNNNTTTKLRKLSLICCYHLIHRVQSGFTSCPNKVLYSKRILSRIICCFDNSGF